MGFKDEYLAQVTKDVLEIFDSPIENLGEHYGKCLDYNGIIESLIRQSFDKRGLRELMKKMDRGLDIKLKNAAHKRLLELCNAECFIMTLPD